MSDKQEKVASLLGGDESKKSTDEKISLSKQELKDLLAEVKKEALDQALGAQTEGFKQLAEAILESRKPYINPAQEANAQAAKESSRRQRLQLLENLKQDQLHCPHIRGSNALSDYPDARNLTAIIKHQLDTGELIGICSNCGKVWRFGDPDYELWMTKKSGNTTSRSGQRFFPDPLAAIKAGQSK